MLVTVFKAISAFFMAICTLISFPVAGNISAPFAPKDEENVKLYFATMSDTHFSSSQGRVFMTQLGLDDMQSADYELDALVHAGDVTDHAYPEDWQNVEKAFADYTPAKNIILALGNHDTWGVDEQGNDSYDISKQLFIEYNKKIADRDIENVYYSTKVNGYTFIVLGSEADHVAADVSEAQLAWLEAEMALAAQDNLPIFIVFHQPLNQTHGLPETWGDEDYDDMTGGIGEQSDAVNEILQKYKNVFYISGHIHNGFGNAITPSYLGYNSVETHGNITSVNLPSYMYFSPRGQIMSGTGFVFEVYEDEVVIRGRSYSSNVWYTAYEYTVPLVDYVPEEPPAEEETTEEQTTEEQTTLEQPTA